MFCRYFIGFRQPIQQTFKQSYRFCSGAKALNKSTDGGSGVADIFPEPTNCYKSKDKIFIDLETTDVVVTPGRDVATRFPHVLRRVPQPVVVVTSAVFNNEVGHWIKRGVTCSSFNSISMKPPVVAFAVTRHSRMHSIMMDTEQYAIHVLAKNQVSHGVHFSRPAHDGVDQFEDIPHELNDDGIPIIRDTMSVMICRAHSIHTIGDHHVWYGEVLHAYNNGAIKDPLLYYAKSFRSVSDEAFLQAFEDTTLPFKDWTHEAHVRMAWNYLREHGKDAATPLIKSGILRYNEQNKEKINRGYNETVTMFYINVINDALSRDNNAQIDTFEEFIERNSYVIDRHLLFEYYSDELLNRKEAKFMFLKPDKIRAGDNW